LFIEAVPPRHGHIMPELARDMRQMSTFATSAAMHENAAGLCSPGWYQARRAGRRACRVS
jgi:hypothetical protein